MIRLVVNADDLGMHPRIDEGIFQAHQRGIVTSATLLVTGRCAPAAVARAREQGLALGVHLCLTSHLTPAAPASEVRWLAPGGRFRKSWAEVAKMWALRLIPAEEVALEFRAQVKRARALGAQPDHLDAHQHLHLLPGVAGIVERIAIEEGLPVRWPSERPKLEWLLRPAAAIKSVLLAGLARAASDSGARKVRGLGLYQSGALDEQALLGVLAELVDGDQELGCHPGLEAGEVPEDPDWRYGWESELAALCSSRVKEAIADREIELTTYGKL